MNTFADESWAKLSGSQIYKTGIVRLHIMIKISTAKVMPLLKQGLKEYKKNDIWNISYKCIDTYKLFDFKLK